MVIPDFASTGRLPEGDWDATWTQVVERYGYNFRRREILNGLEHVLGLLRAHDVADIWLDGSFVGEKLRPSDVDVVYELAPGADDADWDDVGPSRREHLKKFHRVDLWRFPAFQPAKTPILSVASANPITIKEYFSSDLDGVPHGLIRLLPEGAHHDQE